MRVEFRYIGLGIAIGMLLASLLITGMIYASPSHISLSTMTEIESPTGDTSTLTVSIPTALPTLTATVTPTFIIPFTRAPRETETLDPIQAMIRSGQLSFAGPLSVEQQKALYETSLNYIAPTSAQSLLLAKELNNVRYGNPSNTCGPLAIAIMQDARLLGANINPHDFWLLNPNRDGDRALLNRVFPANYYEDIRFRTSLNKFDWQSFPLVPGDFLYIYSGTGGNFDHMLVVSRIDNSLRTYAVTNINTSDGFIIVEVMLYDPNDPTKGIFHSWTETQYAILGSTGFGGFEVWRLKIQ